MADHIFICYTHENTRFTLKLARALRKSGLSIWLDQWETAADEDWEQITPQALRESSHFLLILSPEALNSWVVRDFTLLALREGKRIVPVLYRPCPLPDNLQSLQVVDIARRPFREGVKQIYLQLTGTSPPAEVGRLTLPIEQIWYRLSHYSLPPGLTIALILGLILAGLLLWSSQGIERPARAEPGVISHPILLPTVETLALPNPLPTPINIKARSQDGQIMLFIPAGEFLRGSAEDDRVASDDEKPQRLIYLDQFWLDQTEITYAQYQLCLEAGACTEPQPQLGFFQADQLPIVGVDWEQAQTYCTWVGARLPTEAEWEKAARGTDARLYPWGNEFDGTRLNYCDTNCIADWRDFGTDDAYRFTAPVGSYLKGASPYGVLDMSGNVWEWTADWYAPDAYRQSVYRNPAGPETGVQRVIRGGSWYYQDKSVRITERHKDTPSSRYDNIGFRCAM